MLGKLLSLFEEKPTIEFSSIKEYVELLPSPINSSRAMPEWYRKLKPVAPDHSLMSGTAKRCIPFLDAVTQGYVIPLWSDLYITVKHKVRLFDEAGVEIAAIPYDGPVSDLIGDALENDPDGRIVCSAKEDGEIYIKAEISANNILGAPGLGGHPWAQVGDLCDLKRFRFGKSILKLINPWSIKTPPGWSVAFKNPANSFDNDIHILEGVVDTDEYTPTVNFPFVWRGTDVGEWVIPRGTPLVQVVPFKRQETKIAVKVRDEDEIAKKTAMLTFAHFDRYKTMFWHKRRKYALNDIEGQ